MSTLLAIDPGNDSGWSLWGLISASRVSLLCCGLGVPSFIPKTDHFVIEMPEIYQVKAAPDANILKLAIDMGRRLERSWGPREAFGFFPKTWKGSASKDAHHAELRRHLTDSDLAAANAGLGKLPPSKAHNVWDAIALGRWASMRVRLLHTMSDHVFRPLA